MGATAIGFSSVHGKGAFAARDICAGCVVSVCDFLTDAKREPFSRYAFEGDNDEYVQPVTGTCALMNSACQASDNVRWTLSNENKVMVMVATRDILQGEELLFDYGASYWCDQHGHGPSSEECVKCEYLK